MRHSIVAFLLYIPICAFSASWPFQQIFGYYDKASTQRGLQVFREVCSACHSLSSLRYRELKHIGFSEEQIRALASQYDVVDGPNDDGEMYTRKGRPNDTFFSPYANEQAARSANGGALPTDLSLITKARSASYVFSILTGYRTAPKGYSILQGRYYNQAFEGHQIAMPPPLADDLISYEDGSPSSVEQMAKDVTQFLAWVAEPELEHRHKIGVKSVLYLIAFTILLYFVKLLIWNKSKRER